MLYIHARRFILAICFFAFVSLSATPPKIADVILASTQVWTADTNKPWAEAVAIKYGRILFVGSTKDAESFRGPKTEWIEMPGKLVVPGFNDSHIHLLGGALSLERVDLIEDQTLEAIQNHIRQFAKENSNRPWVLGRGWFYSAFPAKLPTKEQLDAAVPDRPAYMDCYDGHTGWANSAALKLAGITKDTKDPEDGHIVKDPTTGEPTGALKEAATRLVESKIPVPDEETTYQLLLRAFQVLNSNGITSVQDADVSLEELQKTLKMFECAKSEGKLSIRIKAAVRMQQENFSQAISEAQRLKKTHAGYLLQFGTIKGYVDGVIEAKTAAMLDPYDGTTERGSLNWDPEKLKEAVIAADRAGLQVYLHAIGDRGVRTALDAYEAAKKQNGPKDRRGRIEHIETIAQTDYQRFKTFGVIASMQPLHADPNQNIFDVWAKNAGPERSTRAFSWGNFEKIKVPLAFGSDWPIVTSDVRRGLYCSITRKTIEGKPHGGWHPELAVSPENALRHYTIDAAYASFEENIKGSFSLGKLADITVLSQNFLKMPPEEILKTKIVLTILEGKIVYRNKELL
ncbi:amidohydrolase [bacterium]|nr:amidohydrolase [bacterium]